MSSPLAQCNGLPTSLAEEGGTFWLAPVVKVGKSPGKTGCKAVICVTQRHDVSKNNMQADSKDEGNQQESTMIHKKAKTDLL